MSGQAHPSHHGRSRDLSLAAPPPRGHPHQANRCPDLWRCSGTWPREPPLLSYRVGRVPQTRCWGLPIRGCQCLPRPSQDHWVQPLPCDPGLPPHPLCLLAGLGQEDVQSRTHEGAAVPGLPGGTSPCPARGLSGDAHQASGILASWPSLASGPQESEGSRWVQSDTRPRTPARPNQPSVPRQAPRHPHPGSLPDEAPNAP